MEIINVIVTDNQNGSILSINSFPVHEEQLSDEVVKAAEDFFISKLTSNGVDELEAEDAIADGWYEIEEREALVSIVTSHGN